MYLYSYSLIVRATLFVGNQCYSISRLHRNVEPILSNATSKSEPEPRVARVSLVESVVIPGQKGCYLMANVDCDGPTANDILFEPRHETWSALGVCVQESLVHK